MLKNGRREDGMYYIKWMRWNHVGKNQWKIILFCVCTVLYTVCVCLYCIIYDVYNICIYIVRPDSIGKCVACAKYVFLLQPMIYFVQTVPTKFFESLTYQYFEIFSKPLLGHITASEKSNWPTKTAAIILEIDSSIQIG